MGSCAHTFITLNGCRLLTDQPLPVTYSVETYFTVYVAYYLSPKSLHTLRSLGYQLRAHQCRQPHEHYVIPKQTDLYTCMEVIWFDANILLNDAHTKKTKDSLEQSANKVSFYADSNAMIDTIKSAESSSIFLILSGDGADNVLWEIHSLRQLDTVFIFCNHTTKYRRLTKKYDKIACVFSDHETMVSCIRYHLLWADQQNIVTSLFTGGVTTTDLTPSLWWTKLLRHYLSINRQIDLYAQEDMLQKCRAYFRTERHDLTLLFKFEMEYWCDRVIEWYTKPSFLFKIVNQALRAVDYDALYMLRYYIVPLCESLVNYHPFIRRTLCGDKIPVYRGTKNMSKEELTKIQMNIGCLVYTNGFLSTTMNRKLAELFAGVGDQNNEGTHRVIFEILIDPSLDDDCVCADISNMSKIKDEDEVLFDLGSVFRVISVDYVKTSDYWCVKMESCDSTGLNTGETYLTRISEDLTHLKDYVARGRLLVEMGMFEQAIIYHDRLMKFGERKRDLAHICLSIGRTHDYLGHVTIALVYYSWAFQHDETALKAYDFGCKLVCLQSNPAQVLKWHVNPENIAHAHARLQQVREAREKYLELIEECLHAADIDYKKLAEHLNDLANTYTTPEADPIHECTLRCLQRIFPSRHPLIQKTQAYLAGRIYDKNSMPSLPCIRISILMTAEQVIRSLLIESSDTIMQVKTRLEKYYHIPCYKQELIVNNEILEDSRSLLSYNITNEVSLIWKIRSIPKPRIVRIRITGHKKRRFIRLRIQFWFSIYHVKLRLHRKYKYPPPSMQQLFSFNYELQDGTLLYDRLRRNPSFYLLHKKKKVNERVLFHVEMPAEHDTIQFVGDPSQITVHYLKSSIETNRGIPSRFQRIWLNGKELNEDNTSLTTYGVIQHATLTLDLTKKTTVTFWVEYNGRKETIELSPEATIIQLREQLHKKFGVSKDRQKLVSSEREWRSPNNYSILQVFANDRTEEFIARIHLIMLSDTRICDIRIVFSDREQLSNCSVEMNATVKHLKDLISEMSNIQTDKMKLYANMKIIDKEHVAWDETDICHKQTVFVYHTNPTEGFRIMIRFLNEYPRDVQLPGNATVQLLKQSVQYLYGSAANKQRLFHHMRELTDPTTLLRPFAECIIDVLRQEHTFIFLRYNITASNYEIIPIEIQFNDIVGVVRTKAAKKLRMCFEQYLLIQNGKILDIYDNLSLLVNARDILDLSPSKIPIEYIYVKSPDRLERIPLELKRMVTVKDVHRGLRAYLHLPEDQQRLSFREHQLNDINQSLEFHKIDQSSTLQLTLIISLRFVMENDRMFSVTIDQSSNILQLKTVIYNEGFVTSINEQKLLFLGVELDDDLTIRQCRLNNSSLILLLIQKTENLAVSSDHDQYDRFARKRKSIWEARLGFDDAGERVDEDDDNDGDCDNDDEDEDGDSDDEDEDDDSGDDNVDSDDNQHLHCESNAHSNNQSCTDSYLYRNDESDEDEFITSLVFYYPDLK